MLVVLDTNVLVSGLLKAHSAPREIVRLVAYNYIQLAYDARIINEYREVMFEAALKPGYTKKRRI